MTTQRATWQHLGYLLLTALGVLLYLVVVRPALRAQLRLVASANRLMLTTGVDQ